MKITVNVRLHGKFDTRYEEIVITEEELERIAERTALAMYTHGTYQAASASSFKLEYES